MADPLCGRSWPELLAYGIQLEEYELPPFFEHADLRHDAGHGWVIVDGGFEEETQGTFQWRAPGSGATRGTGSARRIRCGDRGSRCIVFDAVDPVDGSTGGHAGREVAERLLRSMSDGRAP